MGDIFFAPISASQALRGSLALLGHVQRAPTPPAGILPAWKRAAARHMAIPLAPKAPGNLDMLSDTAVHPANAHVKYFLYSVDKDQNCGRKVDVL